MSGQVTLRRARLACVYNSEKSAEGWPAPEAVTQAVETCGLRRWPGIPRGLPTLVWPTADLAGYLALAQSVGGCLIYTEESAAGGHDASSGDKPLIGWANHGVLHLFGDPSHVRAAFAPWIAEATADLDTADSEMFVEDDDEFEVEPGLVGLTVRALYNGVDVTDRDGYWDWKSSQNAPAHLRPVIDAVVSDTDYDDWDRDSQHDVLERHAGHLAGDDYELVSNVASSRFNDTVGKALEREVEVVVRELAKHPVAPLWDYGDAISEWVSEVRPDLPVRTLNRVAGQLWQRLSSRREEAERTLRSHAKKILEALPRAARDELGFTRKRLDRVDLLGESLDIVDPALRPRLADIVATLEEQDYGRERERRYATVGRTLLMHGTKAGTARTLGISTTVLDRLVSTHKRNVVISPDDPLQKLLGGT